MPVPECRLPGLGAPRPLAWPWPSHANTQPLLWARWFLSAPSLSAPPPPPLNPLPPPSPPHTHARTHALLCHTHKHPSSAIFSTTTTLLPLVVDPSCVGLTLTQLAVVRKDLRTQQGTDRRRTPEKAATISVEAGAPGPVDLHLVYMVEGSASWTPSYGV